MHKVITLHQIREREADPQVDIDAAQRAELAAYRVGAHHDKMKALAKQATNAASPTAKITLLRELTGYLERALADIAPCADKCSHCCKIPLLVTQAEADVIGKEIKVKPAKVRYVTKGNAAYTGVPCTFLKDDRCSIYKNRPFMCRVHYSMDGDNMLCHLFPGETIKVPYLNNTPYQMVLAEAFGWEGISKIADMRDFFPKGRQ